MKWAETALMMGAAYGGKGSTGTTSSALGRWRWLTWAGIPRSICPSSAPSTSKAPVADHRDLLKPPVGNKNLYADAGDYIVMVVGGPNARKDYHWNETEELFYQVEGDIEVGIQENGKAVTIPIQGRESSFFLAAHPTSPAAVLAPLAW